MSNMSVKAEAYWNARYENLGVDFNNLIDEDTYDEFEEKCEDGKELTEEECEQMIVYIIAYAYNR